MCIVSYTDKLMNTVFDYKKKNFYRCLWFIPLCPTLLFSGHHFPEGGRLGSPTEVQPRAAESHKGARNTGLKCHRAKIILTL